jgi:hypothetical protein
MTTPIPPSGPTNSGKPTVGFLSANNRWGTHYDHFMAIVPDGIEVQIQGLGLYTKEITELEGKAGIQVAKAQEFVAANDWVGITLMGAPMTALEAGAAALRSLGTRKALLLCPFDAPMKAKLQAHLKGEGIDAMVPEDSFATIYDGAAQTSDQLYALAKAELAKAPGAQAIYFQGAPMDPLAIVDQLEADLGVPVICSNPTMLWHICTKVGLKFSIPAKGRLLAEWPDAVGV